MNDLGAFRETLSALMPFADNVPEGFEVNFLGILARAESRAAELRVNQSLPARHVATTPPVIGDGGNAEPWFEAVNWVEAVRPARDHFTMITLGANYGAQAVGAYTVLQRINPMPATLVLVEPEPGNFALARAHLSDNGIDPEDHWLVNLAIGATTDPVFFPVGGPGSGSHNCVATNNESARDLYVRKLSSDAGAALRNLLLHNTTGITRNLVPGTSLTGEIKLVSALTLRELLGPLRFVDYLESDIQQSEINVFPPFMDLLRRKVRRIHIGTHGSAVHARLHEMFAAGGWEIVFSYAPNGTWESALGPFVTNDGVLTVRNPDF